MLSFFTSFEYAYYAVFLHTTGTAEREAFEGRDLNYSVLFTIDIVIRFLVRPSRSSHRKDRKWVISPFY